MTPGLSVGIVTPSLNGERYLPQALTSIWESQGPSVPIDHVVVDGGSTDRTADIVEASPSRLVQAQGNLYQAINIGLSMVRGDILGYINVDDELAHGALERVIEAFEKHPEVEWLFGRVEYIDREGNVLASMKPLVPSVEAFLGIGWSCIPQQTVWARRRFVERVGPFDGSHRLASDFDWYARALAASRPLVMDSTLGRFRLHGENLSFDVSGILKESREIQARYGAMGFRPWLKGKVLSLRLNLRNPRWLWAKKTGRVRFG
jgi:glycosyltransferase involved in cell wall biosynthesis